ncbi:cytochrome P450 3A29-like [Rhipicephalus sanguineus]|uniref:cytochrome P450 3A29-like n=1 Tax=Rhipicephalus sanguineus TaxID=34632 RepID=UPI0018944AA5|nr:cytochrome P450 3A29-like [Rhipicephalus sanguineus]
MLGTLLLSFIIAFSTWFIIQRKRRLSFFKNLGIPGPTPSFLSGNLSELVHQGPLVICKEWLEKYGDIVGFYNGAHPFLIVKDRELIKKIQIKDFNHFHSRGMSSGFERSHQIHKQNLANVEGDRWKRTRSLLTPAFTTSNMKKMVSLMNDSANEFISVIGSMRTKHETLECRELFERMTADVFIRSAFGLKSHLQRLDRTKSITESLFQQSFNVFQQFRRSWIHFLTACFPEFTPVWKLIISYHSRHNKAPIDKVIHAITSVVQFRRVNPENARCDLLQLLLNAEVKAEDPVNVHSLAASDGDDNASEGNNTCLLKLVGVNNSDKRVLTNEEVVANAFSFFIAGFETTGSSLAFLSYLLAKHQDIQDRLREEVVAVLKKDGDFTYDNFSSMNYMDQVMSESIRLFTPIIGFLTRRCAADYIHKGIVIPAGTSILIPNLLMSRDPAFWKEPEKFDPERFSPENKAQIDPSVYQPFGQGPRNCVGMRFAQLEMKLTMAKLLAKYKLFLDDRHIKEKDLELESTFNMAFPKFGGIWLKVEELL